MTSTAAPPRKALLFDVGDVLMEHNWELIRLLGKKLGRDLGARGPSAPETDPPWRRHLAGEITNDEYWDLSATHAGYRDRIELWRAMAHELGGLVFADDSLQLVHDARRAGIPVGILSNDLVRSSGRPWVDGRPEFDLFDVLVDCTELGVRKPDPLPYLRSAELFGIEPADIVFLDDMAYCVEGADAVGMVGVRVDPLDRGVAFARARELVGLDRIGSLR